MVFKYIAFTSWSVKLLSGIMGQRRAGPFKRLALIQVGVYYKYPVILDRKNAIIEYRSSSDTSGLGIEGGIKESAGKVSRNVFLNF